MIMDTRGSHCSLLAVHPLLFNLLCWSINCSLKEEWFAHSYETGFDDTNQTADRESRTLIYLLICMTLILIDGPTQKHTHVIL